jgi:hypothetical protein
VTARPAELAGPAEESGIMCEKRCHGAFSAHDHEDGGSGASGAPVGGRGSTVVTCGALAGHIRDIAARRGWPVTVHALPARLHNRPDQIPGRVEASLSPASGAVVADGAAGAGAIADGAVIVAYGDCGTYGKLDELCARRGVRRLPGLHCYDIYAGPGTVRELFHMEPGTYLLTDYLVRTFDHTVLASLGLDRYPELWADYFGHYTRVVWLAQEPTRELEAEAERIAGLFGLPLTIVGTGLGRLEAALAELIEEGES